MKCKRLNCYQPAAKNQVYCSRDCAPYGNYAGDLNHYPYRSEKTGKSVITGPGEGSKASLDDAKHINSAENDRIKKQKPPLGKRNHIGKIQKNTVYRKRKARNLIPVPGRESESRKIPDKEIQKSEGNTLNNSMQTIENESSRKLKPLNEVAIPATGFTPPSVSIDEASSEVMSLLKKSTTLLFEVMNANKDKPAVICNCASEIHKLIRLKLDIIRAATRH